MDARAALAREANRLAGQSDVQARQYREQRDDLVRALRADDPEQWTYSALAKAVGITPETVAIIIKGHPRRRKQAET